MSIGDPQLNIFPINSYPITISPGYIVYTVNIQVPQPINYIAIDHVINDIVKVKSDGCYCEKCNSFNEYAEPNQPDEVSFICFSCRKGY